jgi:glycine dehydrogenase
MDVWAELAELEESDSFVRRHIGPSETELVAMLHAIGAATLDDVAGKTDPFQSGTEPAAADR